MSVAWVYSVYSGLKLYIALKNSVPVPSAGQCTDCVDSIIILLVSSFGSMKYSNTFIT